METLTVKEFNFIRTIDNLNQVIAKLEEGKQILESQLSEKEKALKNKELAFSRLIEENEKLRNDVTHLDDMLSDKNEKIEELKDYKKYFNESKNLERLLEDANRRHQNALDIKKLTVDRLERENNVLKTTVDELKSKIDELEEEIEQLENFPEDTHEDGGTLEPIVTPEEFERLGEKKVIEKLISQDQIKTSDLEQKGAAINTWLSEAVLYGVKFKKALLSDTWHPIQA